jgi:L-gulonate 5-dehydrogenase
MKALLLRNPKELGIVEVPGPEAADKVVIRVRTVGVCGSDIGAYKGINPLVSYPRILGHEIAGEVVSAPPDSGFRAGERVVTEPYMYCSACHPCRLGRTNCCENLKVMGVHADGGMVEYFAHDPKLLHKVPDALPWEELPALEPLTIALHGLNRAKVTAGEWVVVIGAGTIGLLAAQAAASMGARPIVIDPVAERLALARRLGIEQTVNPASEDAVKAVAATTGGRLAEVVVEASGASPAIRAALDYVAYAGRISLIGWPKEEIPLPTALITKKELDIRGSRNSAREFPAAIELVAAGKVKLAPIISHVIDFAELPACIGQMAERPGDYLKVIAKL